MLTQLHDADRRADDVDVQRCAAALDHIMAQVAEAERVRKNLSENGGDSGSGDADSGDAATLDEPACAACGTLAQPLYEAPRLLGYRCPRCDWTADDPASQAARRLEAARDAAIDATRQASQSIGTALVNLRQRRKKQQHGQGLTDLEAVVASLDSAVKRVGRAEEQLREAERDTGRQAAPA